VFCNVNSSALAVNRGSYFLTYEPDLDRCVDKVAESYNTDLWDTKSFFVRSMSNHILKYI
jgi:hypothetical protein